jgi:hypothetical protein
MPNMADFQSDGDSACHGIVGNLLRQNIGHRKRDLDRRFEQIGQSKTHSLNTNSVNPHWGMVVLFK